MDAPVGLPFLTVAGRSARHGDGQGGAGARRRALPARVWRIAARCGLSVWRHHHRESVVGRPEGVWGNTTRGETAHGGTSPANTSVSGEAHLNLFLCITSYLFHFLGGADLDVFFDVFIYSQRAFGLTLVWFHRRFICREQTSTHAQRTDPRVALYRVNPCIHSSFLYIRC